MDRLINEMYPGELPNRRTMLEYSITFYLFTNYALIICTVVILGTSEFIQFQSPGIISYMSLILFVLTSTFAMRDMRIYVILLPVMLIGFPSAVNNFIPSIYSGPIDEAGASLFPLISHIDVYLVAGLLRFGARSISFEKLECSSNRLLVAIIAAFFIYFVISVLGSIDRHQYLLFLEGSFQIRFLVLFIAFMLYFPRAFDIESISLGLCLSLFCLLFESLTYTWLFDLQFLTSGTLGVNTLANVAAALSLYLMFVNNGKQLLLPEWLRRLALYAGLTIIVLSETRAAIFSFLLLCPLILLFDCRHVSKIKIFETLMTTILIAVVSFAYSSKISGLVYYLSGMSGQQENATLASLDTRMVIFSSTINMIAENPLFGIGAGRWNYLKDQYGIEYEVLLDPHNGFLAILSAYGLPLGLLLIGLLLALPTLYSIRNILGKSSNVGPGLISTSFVLTEMTNASSSKVGIAAILALICVLYFRELGLNRPPPS